MTDWLILIILVPAVLVPIVLLFGFAGCGTLLEIGPTSPTPPAKPTNLGATPIDEHRIDLKWDHVSAGGMEFVISKRRGNDPWVENYQSTYAKQWSETLLDSGKEYSFLVKARNDTVFSDASNIAKARTFIWTEVYKQPLTNNDGPLAGSCLVQRIDKMQLNVTGPVSKVRLSLQGGVNAAGTPLQIERVSVSYPDEGPQGNPNPDAYDSSVPVVVVGPMALPANGTAVWSPVFDFPYVKDKDLLVAFDIKAGNPTQTRKRTTSVGTSKAFSKQSTQEAAIANRLTGYVSQGNAIFLIDKIEMLMA